MASLYLAAIIRTGSWAWAGRAWRGPGARARARCRGRRGGWRRPRLRPHVDGQHVVGGRELVEHVLAVDDGAETVVDVARTGPRPDQPHDEELAAVDGLSRHPRHPQRAHVIGRGGRLVGQRVAGPAGAVPARVPGLHNPI